MHNIVSKKQHIQQSNIVFNGTLKAGYDLTYNYGNPFKISSLKDENYRTEGDEQKDKIVNEHAYQYDANGNLVYVNTAKEKQDASSPEGAREKKYLWDEENRLQAVNINGFISSYWYDANGERVIKASGDDEGMFVNGLFSGARTSTDNFTAYINPYLVVSKGGNYTKHIYMGSQRIVSKLGDLDSYGQDPRRIAYAGSDVDGASVDFAGKYTQSQQTVKDLYADFEVPYNGKDNDDYVNGGGFCCDDSPNLRAGAIGAGNDNPETFQYYYHSDHLGSSSLITNLDGEVVQHVEYVPFGEVFIEERNNKWNTPYLFNAKELDEETGLYYYEARYYDSRISVFLGLDPMWEKYPGIAPYAYCKNNPVKYIDMTGMGPEDRVRYARSMSGIAYPNPNETKAALRTENTAAALKYMDCSEFVCRVLAADQITDDVKYMRSGDLRTFLSDKTKFSHSEDKPQIGDIAVWEGHVGIVTVVNSDGSKIKLTHARGVDKPSQENPHFATPRQYRNSTFYGYYHPIDETPNTNNSVPAAQERIYDGGALPEVMVTAPAIPKKEVKISLLKIE
jgi:RHS repeat-associated protein